MSRDEMKIAFMALSKDIEKINEHIKNHPEESPNVYEIVEANIRVAELLGQYGPFVNDGDLYDQKDIVACLDGLSQMEAAKDIKHHPFFKIPEIKNMMHAIHQSINKMSYDVPTTSEEVVKKRKMLCESMAVPFYIWQQQQRQSSFIYGDRNKFHELQQLIKDYINDGNIEFVAELQGVYDLIKANYYQNQPTSTNEEDLLEEGKKLQEKIEMSNDQVRNNPNEDLNMDEIMDCHISVAELLSQYGPFINGRDLFTIPEIAGCINGLSDMYALRSEKLNSYFIEVPAAGEMFQRVTASINKMNYEVFPDAVARDAKKEMLCKTVSVPFYIWQQERKVPEYQYDNVGEYDALTRLQDDYIASGAEEFVPQIEKMRKVLDEKAPKRETTYHSTK